MAAPEFLFVQAHGAVWDDVWAAEAEDAIERTGGLVLAVGAEAEVEPLESGTPPAAVLLARWSEPDGLDEAWSSALAALVPDDAVALAVDGLPPEGLPGNPDAPTAASVDPPALPTPPSYMTIQGSSTDAARMGVYRDLIWPMVKEREAYYAVLALGGSGVRVLRGDWSEQSFLVSRWPTHEAAHDFWYSDRYQNEAIPARAGVSSFRVHLLRGRAG